MKVFSLKKYREWHIIAFGKTKPIPYYAKECEGKTAGQICQDEDGFIPKDDWMVEVEK